jgi:hypothetical protein
MSTEGSKGSYAEISATSYWMKPPAPSRLVGAPRTPGTEPTIIKLDNTLALRTT